MAIYIYFESYFRQQPYENTFKPENYQEWTVEEKWSVTPNVIQEITLANEDEYFESYYYVDLEIVSVFQESDAKIFKSGRMASNDIKFLIKGNEFSCFQTYCGTVDVNSQNYARDDTYQYKITLTPILQFCDEIFKRPGKRTKIDLIDGLKTLSNDILSMKGNLFSDISIYCGNKRVKAHKNILCARSTVFKKFLQGTEDEQVQSCLEIEQVFVEKDVNSIHGISDCVDDMYTDNDSDAAAIPTEEDNKVQITLNVESEIDADEEKIDDKSSTLTNADKDKEDRNILKIKPKSNDDTTEDDNDCTTINVKKNNKVENTLEIKLKIGDNATVDDSTNNGSDAAAIHSKDNNKVQIILNVKSEIDADEAKIGDKGSTTTMNENKEIRNLFEIKSKSNDDTTENDKYCTAINGKKKNKVQNTLEIKLEIGDDDATVDDSTNDANDTTVIYRKKDNDIQHYLRIKSEMNDDFFEDDNCTDDNDYSTNTNGTITMCSKKDNEGQNKAISKQSSFVKEPKTSFNADTSTTAMSVEENGEIQYDIELESDYGNDILALSAVEGNNVQNNVEIQPEYASNNNEILPPTIEEDEHPTELGESDESSENNILKVRLKKVHSSIFGEFIDFIYSGQYKTMDIKKTKDLLIAARDYGICDLEHKCIMYLRSQISIEMCDDIYSFASVCKYNDLQIYVLDYLKKKIIGRKRHNIHLIQMTEQGYDDIEDEEGLTTFEKIRWLKVMRNHPNYFKDILKRKKGKKIREVFSRFFPETSYDDDDVMAECRERLGYILNACAADLSNVEDYDERCSDELMSNSNNSDFNSF